MAIAVAIKDTPLFESSIGDIMELNQFLECRDNGAFTMDDGDVGEVLLNNHVIADVRDFKSGDSRETLLATQEEHGTLHVVWYNK